MKYEWKKSEKESYLPKPVPVEVTLPEYKYFTIIGSGDPNGEEFGRRVTALYALAYAVRMMPKNGFTPEGYFEYTVYPLEGVWSGDARDKDSYNYTIMIRQPDFVNEDVYKKALAIAGKKKPGPELKDIRFEKLCDGKSVQIMHLGSYDSEPDSFAKMQKYVAEKGLKRLGEAHREIYLTDPSKGNPSKQKTVLRYRVQ